MPLLGATTAGAPAAAAAAGALPRKRARPVQEEWGGMKFHCPLTKICTLTPDRMRLHVQGDFYKRMAASTPDWEDSTGKKEFLQILEEAEALEEQQRKARKAVLTANTATTAATDSSQSKN
mmetsp:Transcript_13856/g.39442  ORF Transcript_13856/g.39442 Transcript_13856/m.39442 type:complete len:121 (-) Transcript_13856:75-437(-)